jgi:hypothetical protein
MVMTLLVTTRSIWVLPLARVGLLEMEVEGELIDDEGDDLMRVAGVEELVHGLVVISVDFVVSILEEIHVEHVFLSEVDEIAVNLLHEVKL